MKRFVGGLAAVLVGAAVAAPASAQQGAACFEVQMGGLSGQADPTSPFDGFGAARIGGKLVLFETSTVPTNDVSVGHIDATSHTLTFASDPGEPWDGAVVVTEDAVEPIPLEPGVHPLMSVLTAVEGASGQIASLPGSTVDFTDPAGGQAAWLLEGELCFG